MNSATEGRGLPGWALLLFVAILLCGYALVAPVDHDESQYVAAARLATTGLPYRDFAYLQTPLQPMLFVPLTLVAANRLWLVLRLVNALLVSAAAALVWLAARRHGASRQNATVAAGVMLCCEAALFGASVARNDALPMALFALALWLLSGEVRPRRTFFAALALGFAASAKISYAFPCLALLLASLVGGRAARDRLPPVPVITGLAVPTAYTLAIMATAPAAAWFEVVRYGSEAPHEWYTLTGRASRLGMGHYADFLVMGLRGPALVALAAVVVGAWRSRGSPLQSPLLALLAASLVGAALPDPAQIQYWTPALPPLFLALAVAMERGVPWRPAWMALLAITALVGLRPVLKDAASALRQGPGPLLSGEGAEDRLSAYLQKCAAPGPVAGQSAHYFADNVRPIDRRFAAGPFLWRTMRLIDEDEASKWHVATFRNVEGLIANRPAAYVFAKDEERYSGSAILDGRLRRVATQSGFAPRRRFGDLTLWMPVAAKYSPGC